MPRLFLLLSVSNHDLALRIPFLQPVPCARRFPRENATSALDVLNAMSMLQTPWNKKPVVMPNSVTDRLPMLL